MSLKIAKQNHALIWFHSVDVNSANVDGGFEETIINILNVHRLWTEYPDLVVCPALRIAMDKDDKETIIELLELSASKMAIAEDKTKWITRRNSMTSQVYLDEIAAYREWKNSVHLYYGAGKQFVKMSGLVKTRKQVIKTGKPVGSGTSKGKPLKMINIQDKLNLLAKDKFYNVSNIKDNGAGLVTHEWPTKKTKLFWTDREPLLRLMANSYESFAKAVSMLEEPEQYEDHLNDIYELSGGNSAKNVRKKAGTTQQTKGSDDDSDEEVIDTKKINSGRKINVSGSKLAAQRAAAAALEAEEEAEEEVESSEEEAESSEAEAEEAVSSTESSTESVSPKQTKIRFRNTPEVHKVERYISSQEDSEEESEADEEEEDEMEKNYNDSEEDSDSGEVEEMPPPPPRPRKK